MRDLNFVVQVMEQFLDSEENWMTLQEAWSGTTFHERNLMFRVKGILVTVDIIKEGKNTRIDFKIPDLNVSPVDDSIFGKPGMESLWVLHSALTGSCPSIRCKAGLETVSKAEDSRELVVRYEVMRPETDPDYENRCTCKAISGRCSKIHLLH